MQPRMLLLTLNEWNGPGRRYPPGRTDVDLVTQRTIGMVTRLSLKEAIDRLSDYRNAYNAHFRLAVEFRLLGVATIDNLDPGRIDAAGLTMVENLAQGPDDFE